MRGGDSHARGEPALSVTLVTPGFSADETDWCIPSLLHLVRELSRRHVVRVLSLRYPASARRSYRVHGAEVRSLGGGQRHGILSRARLLVRGLAVLVRPGGRRPDVIHGLWADEPGFLAAVAARLLRRPSVVSLLGGELTALPLEGYGHQLHRGQRVLIGAALRLADHVTVGSRSFAAAASERVGARRLSVLPWGVDTALFDARGRESQSGFLSGAPALLHVGSLTPVKDQALLLRTLRSLAADLPEAHLHLVGDGGERATLEQLAASLGLSERVFFHGSVRHELLPPFYRAADLFLLSSRHESQCMAVLEAAACGAPTVGMAVGVVPDLGPAARPVVERDPGRFASVVRSLVRSPQEIASMREACLEAVANSYSLPVTSAGLSDLYGSLVRPTANRE